MPFPADRRMSVDMVFELMPDCRLAVEYDGAYWHEGKEHADARKSDQLVRCGFAHRVMRVREAPLELIAPDDVSVAKGAKAAEIVQLALMHLVCRPPLDDLYIRIVTFLECSSTRLAVDRIRCPRCVDFAISHKLLADPSGSEQVRRRSPRAWRARPRGGIRSGTVGS